MSSKYLGLPFDIHGGGKDLIFPHHENERAQTEAATGERFANYWLHNGFVNIEKEKMSKSLGNFLLIRDFVKDYHPEVLRLFFLSTHYRNPVDYNEQSIDDANHTLHRLYATLERVAEVEGSGVEPKVYGEAEEIEKKFYEAMDDDFNTALGLSYIFELSRMLNKLLDEKPAANTPFILYTHRIFLSLAGILGLLHDDLAVFGQNEKRRHLNRAGLDDEMVERMVAERTQARKNKDFKKADEIRDTLTQKGILLMDSPKGTEWRVKPIQSIKGEN